MTSYRQPKRKRVEICRQQDECMNITAKKPANRTVQPHKVTESIRMPLMELPTQLQIPSTKIKLQLFPINEQIRMGLEKDGYNPFLELTLSPRKRISSVVRHLNAKWGSSIKGIRQLMLFPYNTKLEQLASCRRWTSNDDAITAWEVYVNVGSPSIFRLRYGWFSNLQQDMFEIPPKSSLEAHTGIEGSSRDWIKNLDIPDRQYEHTDESCEIIKTQINENKVLDPDVNELMASNVPTDLVDDQVTSEIDQVHPTVHWDDNWTDLSIGGLLSEISLQGKINGLDPNSVKKSSIQPIGVVSDISIGDLLSEASLLGKMSNPMKLENGSSLQPIFLSTSDVSMGGLFSEASLLSNKNKLDTRTTDAGHEQIQTPWDDTFTTLSIGGLLSEPSLQAKAGGNRELKESTSSLKPNSSLSRSFDSHIFSNLHTHSQMAKPSYHESNLSILDAEETCHAFPVRKLQPSRDATASNAKVFSIGCSNCTSSIHSQFPDFSKMNNENVPPKDFSCQELKTEPSPHFL